MGPREASPAATGGRSVGTHLLRDETPVSCHIQGMRGSQDTLKILEELGAQLFESGKSQQETQESLLQCPTMRLCCAWGLSPLSHKNKSVLREGDLKSIAIVGGALAIGGGVITI